MAWNLSPLPLARHWQNENANGKENANYSALTARFAHFRQRATTALDKKTRGDSFTFQINLVGINIADHLCYLSSQMLTGSFCWKKQIGVTKLLKYLKWKKPLSLCMESIRLVGILENSTLPALFVTHLHSPLSVRAGRSILFLKETRHCLCSQNSLSSFAELGRATLTKKKKNIICV